MRLEPDARVSSTLHVQLASAHVVFPVPLLTHHVVLHLLFRTLSACSIPTSRLVLKAKPFSCSTARQHIAAQLEAAGVAAWRFDLLPLTASTQVGGNVRGHLCTVAAAASAVTHMVARMTCCSVVVTPGSPVGVTVH